MDRCLTKLFPYNRLTVGDPKKERLLGIRATPEEHARFFAYAKARGLKMSAWALPILRRAMAEGEVALAAENEIEAELLRAGRRTTLPTLRALGRIAAACSPEVDVSGDARRMIRALAEILHARQLARTGATAGKASGGRARVRRGGGTG